MSTGRFAFPTAQAGVRLDGRVAKTRANRESGRNPYARIRPAGWTPLVPNDRGDPADERETVSADGHRA